MKTYLVLLRCGCDNLPLFLSSDLDESIAFAKGIDFDSAAVKQVEEVFSINVSDFTCVSIITFTDGVPTSCDTVKDFDDVAA